jgi:AcrR family transcriptional regulator
MIAAMSLLAVPDERSRPERARRSARASGDERERAIMRTAEQLLGERPLSQISVDALARGAGISRSAFYFYFPSKAAVVLSLVERLVDEAAAARDEALRSDAETGPDSWRGSIAIFYEIFGAHRAVIEAAVELSATDPEAQQLWAEVMEGWVQHVAERIDSERAGGVAPAGVPARELAIALVQMNERALRSVFTGDQPAIAESEAIDVLAHVWVSAIYAPARS